MSDKETIGLLDSDPKYLLLNIDAKTGRQNAVSLLTYGRNPDAPDETLIFTTSAPHTYQEISLKIKFDLFHTIMLNTSHFDVTNIGQTHTKIDPASEMGKFITDFKNWILSLTSVPPSPGMN